MTRACTFGIEEEYLLVELATGRIRARPTSAVIDLCRQVLGAHFAQEMFHSQIEVASPVFASLSQADDFLRHCRRQLSTVLANEGLGVVAVGSHPMGGWRLQHSADEDHFRQLFEDYQQVARRSLLCGLHVHVGVADNVDRIKLINQLLPWLPLLLLLSASSPFWEGQPSGYQSYRQVACGEWPRMGLPPRLVDWQAYERYLALLRRTGALRQGNDCWWVIRPSRQYPTVELRIADACPRLEDALCIAGLFRCMVEHCLRHPDKTPLTRERYWITEENYWRAMRYARHGQYICLPAQGQGSAQQWLAQARQVFEVRPCDSERSFDHAAAILQGGTSADWQLAEYERCAQHPDQALRAVVSGLLEMTACCGKG